MTIHNVIKGRYENSKRPQRAAVIDIACVPSFARLRAHPLGPGAQTRAPQHHPPVPGLVRVWGVHTLSTGTVTMQPPGQAPQLPPSARSRVLPAAPELGH